MYGRKSFEYPPLHSSNRLHSLQPLLEIPSPNGSAHPYQYAAPNSFACHLRAVSYQTIFTPSPNASDTYPSYRKIGGVASLHCFSTAQSVTPLSTSLTQNLLLSPL